MSEEINVPGTVEVFKFFSELSQVPRGSRYTKKISDFLVDFAKERNLSYYQDKLNNVIIRKEASEGYENADPVILQAHIDMVCEKVPGSTHDFENDPISIQVDGDWMTADGTTLGGDDGIGVAMILTVLDSDEIKHPAIEGIFTVDEEIGLLGAAGLDANQIHARKMINLDSEEEGIITVGCGGGAEADIILPVARENKKGLNVTLKIDGLRGGHSGAEIHKERANANILMGRLLYEVKRSVPFSLVNLAGGNKNNAITKICEADIVIEPVDYEELCDVVDQVAKDLAHEYRNSDPDVKLSVIKGEVGKALAITEGSLECLVTFLMNAPQGIQHMSTDLEGLVETSLNLGVLNLTENELRGEFCVRSAVASRRHNLQDKLDSLLTSLGGYVNIQGEYPAWEYKADSTLRDVSVKVYEEQYGEEPRVEAIHAGLECGLFAGKLGEDYDAISIGPDMEGVHTTEERLNIPSTKRVWKYLTGVLAAMK